nr:hypothetical protein [Tanacetum cinerariifolium]
VKQEIRDQLNAEAEAVKSFLLGLIMISTQQLTLQHQHEVNEIRAEKIARIANPLPLVAQQQQVYHPQTHPTHYNQHSSIRTHQADTRKREKAIVNSPQPIYDQEPSMVDDDEDTSKDKEIDKLMALISLSFKKIYKPTNNNLRTSSNTSRANHDNSPRIHRNARYKGQRSGSVAGARETVDSLTSQLETLKTQYVNEIDRLSKEYYYADHMNAILELSKSKKMSKSFESVQKHAINHELELQQCKEKVKNDVSSKVNKSKDFCKEREQYFEIQDLKAQLQDKGIVISELKKLIEKLKGKSMDTKFEKSSIIRQPNALKSQRPSVLGTPTTFSNSFIRKDFSKSTSVTQNNVSNDFLKPVTAQTFPANKKSCLKNTKVLSPGMYKIHTDHT